MDSAPRTTNTSRGRFLAPDPRALPKGKPVPRSFAVLVIALLALVAGCQRSEEILNEGSQPGLGSEVSSYDYSLNHFFVDTLYRSVYEPYFSEEPPGVVNPAIQVVRQEVWVQRAGIYPDPNERPCRAFVSLPPRNSGYDPRLRAGEDTAGETVTAPMILLNAGEYTMMGNGYTGILTIDRPFYDNMAIAIAYRREDGTQFGEFVGDVPPESLNVQNRPLILHLVKPSDLNAVGRAWPVPWAMLVKSIYPLGARYISMNGFSLRIVRRVPGLVDQPQILGHSLLNLLGLDSYDQNWNKVQFGDGVFDFMGDHTIDPLRGEIIFPSLRPFDDGLRTSLQSKGLWQLTGSVYLMPQIYDTTADWARIIGRSTYVLQWRER